jgi:hypothetical protein
MTPTSETTPTLISWLVFNPSRDAQHGTTPGMWTGGHRAAVVARVQQLAPYAAILVLPGGSLMALLLWLHRRRLTIGNRL